MFGFLNNPKIDEVAKHAQAAIASNGVDISFREIKKITKTYLGNVPKKHLENAHPSIIAAFVLATEGAMLSTAGEDPLFKVCFDSIPILIKEVGASANQDDLIYLKMTIETAQKVGVKFE